MSLKVYNTLGRKKETFTPLKEGAVRMYVCGVTVYDEPHLGHARAYVVFDIIRRYLEYRGYKVTYVQNITDVDDKIIQKAKEEKGKGDIIQAVKEISERYIQMYFQEMDALNIKRAHYYPRATEHIPQMQEMVRKLLENGYAYEVEGEVYFQVSKFPTYGKLSGRSLEEMRAGARVEVDLRKKNPLDFALWKKAKEGEPSWSSPWGEGRPGWHIECSAMSREYLGDSFDIHGGGEDLIFPHHENEIAQSEAYTGRPFVKYWLHNGFVTVNGEKMSKSLGNFFTIREILQKCKPEVVRFLLLSTHYRSPIDFSLERLEEAKRGWERLYLAKKNAEEVLGKAEGREGGEMSTFKERFIEAMDDDFHTPRALAALFDLTSRLNQAIEKKDKKSVGEGYCILRELSEALGLTLEEEERELPPELLKLIKEREEARRKHDWRKADAIREKLSREGLILQDIPGGTRWRWKK